MARCPTPNVNLDDSDETFYCPDLDKDPGEARDLDCPGEDDDGFFEQAYSRSGPSTDETFFEQAENALRGGYREREDASPGPRSQAPLPDTDETFFEPAEIRLLHARLQGLPPDPDPEWTRAPDSDQTFYEPAERARRERQAAAGQRRPPQDPRHDEHLITENGKRLWQDSDHSAGPSGCGVGQAGNFPVEQDVDFIDGGLMNAGLVAESSLFTHDPEWSECWPQQDHETTDGGANDLYVQLQDPVTHEMRMYKVSGAQAAPETLRLLTQDLAWTQQLALPQDQCEQDPPAAVQSEPGLPGGQASGRGACSMALFTQDLAWTQQLVLPQDQQEQNPPGQDDPPAAVKSEPGHPGGQASMGLFTQDLAWTQQAWGQASNQAMGSEPKGLEEPGGSSMRLFTQDLGWTQTQLAEEPMALGASSSGDQSMMDAGCSATTTTPAPDPSGGPRPPRGGYSSVESSEPHAVPSLPSFDDDVPPTAAQTVPWPLLLEDHLKIEEIVKSLSGISFNLDTAASLRGVHLVDEKADGDVAALGPAPSVLGDAGSRVVDPTALATPPSTPAPPKSPTFSTNSRRRYRRPRPRAVTGPPDVGRPGGCSGQGPRPGGARIPCPSPSLYRSPARPAPVPGKRKRTGAGSQQSQHRRSQSQSAAQPPITCSPLSPPRQKPRRSRAPVKGRPEMVTMTATCSPSSPPRQKVRKSVPLYPPGVLNQDRAALMATYTRLQELRFFMQDILGGREPLPAAEQVADMQQEVLGIIDSIRQAASSEGPQTSKARLKREQAQQVADKLLHQFRVINESQESCVAAEGSTESNPQAMSWSDTTVNGPPDAAPVQSTMDTESCLEEKKFHTGSPHSQHNSSQRNHMKRRGRKRKGTKKNSRSCSNDTQEINVATSFIGKSQREEIIGTCCSTSTRQDLRIIKGISNKHLVDQSSRSLPKKDTCATEIPHNNSFTEAVSKCISNVNSELPQVVSCGDNSNCPQANIVSSAECQADISENSELVDSSACDLAWKPEKLQSMDTENAQEVSVSDAVKKEQDNEKQAEYQEIVKLIKVQAAIPAGAKPVENEAEDFIWRGGPLKLTGVLLPKKSELTPIDNLPPNFWDDPQAPIPEEWISMLDWDD